MNKIILSITCIFTIVLWFHCGSYEYEPDELSAYAMAQQFVEQRLKAPSTAKFPGGSWNFVEKIGEQTDMVGHRYPKYRIKAYVDSQNAFGAQIRTHFVCEITYLGSKKWQLDSLGFLN